MIQKERARRLLWHLFRKIVLPRRSFSMSGMII